MIVYIPVSGGFKSLCSTERILENCDYLASRAYDEGYGTNCYKCLYQIESAVANQPSCDYCTTHLVPTTNTYYCTYQYVTPSGCIAYPLSVMLNIFTIAISATVIFTPLSQFRSNNTSHTTIIALKVANIWHFIAAGVLVLGLVVLVPLFRKDLVLQSPQIALGIFGFKLVAHLFLWFKHAYQSEAQIERKYYLIKGEIFRSLSWSSFLTKIDIEYTLTDGGKIVIFESELRTNTLQYIYGISVYYTFNYTILYKL